MSSISAAFSAITARVLERRLDRGSLYLAIVIPGASVTVLGGAGWFGGSIAPVKFPEARAGCTSPTHSH